MFPAQIIQQSATLFNYLGALQQKAPAQLTITDALIHELPADTEWADTVTMPATIVRQMRDIDALAQSLPALKSEARITRPHFLCCRSRLIHAVMCT